MFTGARDFNIDQLDIINAGRDVNINLVNTGSPVNSIDLQALFSGSLDATGVPIALEQDNRLGNSTADDVHFAQSGEGRTRRFKRALSGLFTKRTGHALKSVVKEVQVVSPTTAKQMEPMAEITAAEIYVRGLLASGNGLPCWNPRPPSGSNGIVPGDVGTYSVDRGFEKIFNLWDDELGIQAIVESLGGDSYQPPRRTIVSRRGMLKEGDVVTRGVDGHLLPSSSGSFAPGFEFDARGSSQGAILALTSPADLEAIEDETILHLRESIIQHAGMLYLYAHRMRRLRAEDSSLYVVTGCVNSDAWAVGAFSKPMGSGCLTLSRTSNTGGGRSTGPVYQWNQPGSIWAELFTGQSLEGEKNQTLFLRGFKVGYSPAFRLRVARSISSGAPIPSSRLDPATMYHPCDVINTRILHQTGVDIALSHDDNWRLLFKTTARGGANAFDLESLDFKGHGNTSTHLQISVRNGVGYIESLEFEEKEDTIRRNNRQKDLDLIVSDTVRSEKDEIVFNVIPESELSFYPGAGGYGFRVCASGGRADFFLANRKGGNSARDVAIKVSRKLRRHYLGKHDEDEALSGMRSEYKILSMLSHRNVLRLEGLATIKNTPTHGLVFNHKALGDLPRFLKRSMPFNRMQMVVEIAQGLEYIHDMRIVHGSFEPRKILVDIDPSTGLFFPLICGFRSSRIMEDDPATPVLSTKEHEAERHNDQDAERETTRRVYVTPEWYRPPELVGYSGDVDARVDYSADVYSFGLLVQELITGEQPYTRNLSPVLRLSDRLANQGGAPISKRKVKPVIEQSYEFIWPILEDCWRTNPEERITMKEAHKRLRHGSEPPPRTDKGRS